MNDVKMYKILRSEIEKKCMNCSYLTCMISNKGDDPPKTLRERVFLVMFLTQKYPRLVDNIRYCDKG